MGGDNNLSTKLYGFSGVMEVYRKYLEYQLSKLLILNQSKKIKMFYMNQNG